MKLIINIITLILLCSCSSPQPLTYMAVEKPTSIIKTEKQKKIRKEFSKSGWYIGNKGFRPASNIEKMVKEISNEAGTPILKDADVCSNVTFGIDILFFGYNFGSDIAANNNGIDD